MLQSSVQDSSTPSGYFDALLCGGKGHLTASMQPDLPDLNSLAATCVSPLEEQLQGILRSLMLIEMMPPHQVLSACKLGNTWV